MLTYLQSFRFYSRMQLIFLPLPGPWQTQLSLNIAASTVVLLSLWTVYLS